MSLQIIISAIVSDTALSYDEKREKLLKLMTLQEVNAMFPNPSTFGVVRLKEPLHPKTENMRILNLSVIAPVFEGLLNGNHVECREYNEYFMSRCTYVEDGVRYLIPYDAITFHVGYGKRVRKATLALKDIVCNGDVILFYLGKVLSAYDDQREPHEL